jgi:hypothetical protein
LKTSFLDDEVRRTTIKNLAPLAYASEINVVEEFILAKEDASETSNGK